MATLLFGTVLWFWIGVSILALSCIISEATKEGRGSFVVFLIFLLCYYFSNELVLGDYLGIISWTWVGVYIGIGIVFAIFRTWWYGYENKEEYQKLLNKDDKNSAGYFLEKKKRYLKGNVTRWMAQWPISLPYWILIDLLGEFWSWVYDVFANLFTHLFEFGIGAKKLK